LGDFFGLAVALGDFYIYYIFRVFKKSPSSTDIYIFMAEQEVNDPLVNEEILLSRIKKCFHCFYMFGFNNL
jgi:hypothetical protein